MILADTVPVHAIDIWTPRWHDKVVLVAKYKVGEHNLLTFSKTPSLTGEYYLSGETIRGYPLETNGRIECFAVKLSELEGFARGEHTK